MIEKRCKINLGDIDIYPSNFVSQCHLMCRYSFFDNKNPFYAKITKTQKGICHPNYKTSTNRSRQLHPSFSQIHSRRTLIKNEILYSRCTLPKKDSL